MPQLLTENKLPLEVYLRVQGQHIMGVNGPVDIRQERVWFWMRKLSVPKTERIWCFDLVCAAYHAVLEVQREKDRK